MSQSLSIDIPHRLSKGAWHGHMIFAQWITKVHKPSLLVELGTHNGDSYFSFCQSVRKNCLKTKCHAIDSWEGESHAGFYGNEVYESVNNHNNEFYSDFSTLHKCYFDEAVTKFKNKSIDLLHIDGYHTYEAVKHDFETWRPKLSKNAIVLFHDTAEVKENFGVWKFWKELEEQYPEKTLLFLHSHGLGVLAIGNEYHEDLMKVFQSYNDNPQIVQDFYNKTNSYLIEPKERLLTASYLQKYNIFIDIGNGFSENDKESIQITNSYGKNKYFLSKYQKIKKIRIDFGRAPKLILIRNLSLTLRDNSLVKCKIEDGNYVDYVSYLDGSLLLFTKKNPRLYVEVDTENKYKSLSYNFEILGFEEITSYVRLKELENFKDLLSKVNRELKESNNLKTDENKSLIESYNHIVDENKELKDTNTLILEENKELKDTNTLILEENKELKETNTLIIEENKEQMDVNSLLKIEKSNAMSMLEDKIKKLGILRLENKNLAKDAQNLMNQINEYESIKSDITELRKSINNKTIGLDINHDSLRNEQRINSNTIDTMLVLLRKNNTNDSLFLRSLKKSKQIASSIVFKERNKKYNNEYITIKDSGLFDEVYYLRNNTDLLLVDDLLKHFVIAGYKESRNPNPMFDIEYYLKKNEDVKESCINPLVHFIEYGAKEMRNPHPIFNTKYYVENNTDLYKNDINPLAHYINYGFFELRNPHPMANIKEIIKEKKELKSLELTSFTYNIKKYIEMKEIEKFKINDKNIKMIDADNVIAKNRNEKKEVNSLKIRGNIENSNKKPVIKGWVCTSNENGKKGTEAKIYVNGKYLSIIKCKTYRKDLNDHDINGGYAGFVYDVPMKYVDGKKRKFQIKDISGNYLISQKEMEFKINRNFKNFDEYLKWSFFNRELNIPFREEDKRCLAYMDWLTKYDAMRFTSKFSETVNKPLVSIVMPAFNRAYIIANAIKSVINQTYDNWELLIIDDGSKDNTKSVINSFKDERIKYRYIKNSGVSCARNRALEISKGNYIAYLDTDNDWDKDYLLISIGNLEEKKDYDCAYTAQYLYKNKGNPYAVRFGLFNRTLLENRNYIDMNSFIHRKSLCEKYGVFDEKMKRLVDWDLILRYTVNKKPLAIKNILSNYYYNENEETITNNNNLNDALQSLNSKIIKENKWMKFDYSFIYHNNNNDKKETMLTNSRCYNKDIIQKKNTSIIIVSFNIPEILKICIKSVIDTTNPLLTEIIIVDNNSDEETKKMLNKLNENENIKIIYNNENLGFTAAVNQGIKASKPNNEIVLLNNDSIATVGWLASMENVVMRNKDAGIIAPQQVLLEGTNTINTHVPFANYKSEIDVTVSMHHNNLVLNDFEKPMHEFKVDFIPFFCVYITRQVIKTIGLLDEKLGRHYRSDRLYCYSLLYNTDKCIYYTPSSKLYHLHQQSTNYLKNSNNIKFDEMFVRNSWDNDSKQKWDM